MASGFPGSIDSFTNPLSNSALNSPSHAGQHQDLNDAVNKIETYMGLVHITTQTFSGATQVDFVNVFSSLYNSYRIVFHYWTATVAENHFFRLRDASGVLSGVTYITQRLEQNASTVTGLLVGGGSSTTWFPTYINAGAGGEGVAGTMDIFSPNLPTYTRATGQFSRWDPTGGYTVQFAGLYNAGTQLTGFSLIRNVTATMSGKVSVFGYRV